jgi:hypothetical protein
MNKEILRLMLSGRRYSCTIGNNVKNNIVNKVYIGCEHELMKILRNTIFYSTLFIVYKNIEEEIKNES